MLTMMIQKTVQMLRIILQIVRILNLNGQSLNLLT